MSRILLIGGSRLFRDGLRLMLEDSGNEIAGEANSVDEAVTLEGAGAEPPLYLLKANIECRHVRRDIETLRGAVPDARIAVIARQMSAEALVNVFAAGGDGFILEDIPISALHESLKLIDLGEKVFPSQLAALLGGDQPLGAPGIDRSSGNGILSSREVEILRCLTAGLPNKLIANELDLAVATVKVHIKSVLRKLGLNNRTQAAIWALERGLVEPPSVLVPAQGTSTGRDVDVMERHRENRPLPSSR